MNFVLVYSNIQLDVGSFDLSFSLELKMKYQVSYESSKFNFGNLSIVNDEWDTKKVADDGKLSALAIELNSSKLLLGRS